MRKSIGVRLEALEDVAAARASQQKDEPSIDYTKLSDEALEEIVRVKDEFGEVDSSNLSAETLLEIKAARRVKL